MQVNSANTGLRIFIGVSAAVLALLCLALLLWASNKGLDVIDESYYIMCYQYVEDYHAMMTNFHLITNAVLGGKHLTVVGYRVAYLVMLFIQSVIFAQGVVTWIKKRGRITVESYSWLFCGVLAVFYLAALVVFAHMPRTLSYNSITSLIVYTTSGVILYVCVDRLNSYRAIAACVLIGFLLVFAFANKFSSCIALLGWHSLLLLSLRYRNLPKLIAVSLPSLLLGGVLGCLTYFGAIQSFADWQVHFLAETAVVAKAFGPVTKIGDYVLNALDVLKFAFFPGGIFLIAVWLLSPDSFPLRHRRYLKYALALVLLLAFGFICYENSIFDSPTFNEMLLVKLVFVFLISIVILRFEHFNLGWRSLWADGPVLIWLLGLPAVAAFGTANYLLTNMLMDITAWFAAGAILLMPLIFPPVQASAAVRSKQPFVSFWLIVVLACAPIAYLAEQMIYGVVFRPYMSFEPLMEQNSLIIAPDQNQEIYVTKEYKRLLAELALLLQQGGYKAGDSIVALDNMPGFVYLLGGRSPNAPWYFGFDFERNLHALALDPKPLPSSYLLINKDFTDSQLAGLQKSGLNFPDEYRLLGEATGTYSRIIGKNATIKVYAPVTIE